MPIPHKLPKSANPLAYKAGRDVLALFDDYPALTAQQVIRLLDRSDTYVRRWLKELSERRLLNDHTFLPTYQTSIGGTTKLYHTGKHAPSPLLLPHRHTLTDVLISAELLGREPDVELLEWVHERDLRQTPASVIMPDGKPRKVVMDGFIGFRVNEATIYAGLEADCGSEQQLQWRTKVRALVQYASAVYPKQRPDDPLTVAVYVRAMRKQTPRRLLTLLNWTAKELANDDPAWDHFFRFTMVDPVEVGAHDFWLGPYWVSPVDREPSFIVPEVAR